MKQVLNNLVLTIGHALTPELSLVRLQTQVNHFATQDREIKQTLSLLLRAWLTVR